MLKYTKKQIAWKLIVKKCLFAALLSLPIILFLYIFSIRNRNGALYGDWDYFAQLYEAARRSILEFHQFPWWNPWVIGGVPLYANPQFGLFSIQMPLVLIFGTLKGLHFAVIIYYLLGFWGMYTLLGHLKRGGKWLRILLSYIWIFSGFPSWHISGGHLTFAAYLLSPWLFLALLRLRQRRGWLWLGLLTAFFINQSLHYMTIQMYFVGGLYVVYELIRRWREHELSWWHILKPYTLAAAVALPLSAHKIYYTLQYTHQFIRIPAPENANPISLLVAALSFRQPIDPISTFHSVFGWAEYCVYFGLITLGLLVYTFLRSVEKRQFNRQQVLLLAGMAFFLLVAVGPISKLAPYSLLKDLPVFNEMQVASRWLAWFVLAAILYLFLKLPRKPFVYILLLISACDVFAVGHISMSYDQPPYTPPARSTQFQQYAYYQNQPVIERSSLRFLSATQANIGDTFGYEPMAQFSIVAPKDFSRGLTIRCGSNQSSDCPFVLSRNATMASWSPQRLVFKRTAPGNIELNMNPGMDWYVNGKQAFPHTKIFELKKRFIITDPSSTITLTFKP